MNTTRIISMTAAALVLAGVCAAGQNGILITDGKQYNIWPWRHNDSAGYVWDLYNNGKVNNGSNDAYDGGMILQVDGAIFNVSNSAARISQDGTELELGPWNRNSVRIWRRIYVNKKAGYCRWIDIYENSTGNAQNLNIRYYSGFGSSIQMVHSTSGNNSLTPRDWGLVTSNSSGSSRPNIIQVFASPSANVKPRVQYNVGQDNIYYYFNLKVPPGKTRALCFFHAQRRSWSESQKFLKDFKPSRELHGVPAPLRRIIVNMGGTVLGKLELPRHDQHDIVVLKNEDELLGTLLNKEFVIGTFYGKLTLPAKDVIGLRVPSPADPYVHVGLTDGQVPAGRLLNGPVRIRLTGGNEMSIPAHKLLACSFRISPQHPEEVKITQPVVVLRSGQRLFFEPEDVDLHFLTEYGRLKLNPDDLHAVILDTPDSGLHRAVFTNGSVLSGLLAPSEFAMKLDLGPTLEVRRQLIMQFILNPAGSAGDQEELAELKTRNEDTLRGRIVDEFLPVQTRYETVRVKSCDIAKITFLPEKSTPGAVKIKLFDGTMLSGRLKNDSIRFRTEPGPELGVFVGHIKHMTCPKPPPAPKTKPAATRPENGDDDENI